MYIGNLKKVRKDLIVEENENSNTPCRNDDDDSCGCGWDYDACDVSDENPEEEVELEEKL